ncbi:MAG: 7TM-DISM domain-containing protein [Ginsengibacter sp.]
MIKYFTTFVFISAIGIQVFAQQPVLLTDTTSLVSIGKQIDVFKDPGEKLSLQHILTPRFQSQFKKSTQEVPNFGTKQIAVWCRIHIKNASHKDWVLDVDFPNLHSVTLFQPSGNGYAKEETGRSFPFSRRNIKNRSFLFALQLKQGEEKEIYLRVENHICIFPVYIGDMTAISERQHPEDTFYGIFYGISLIIAFYAMAQFVTTREVYYFYFFVQVIFFVLYGMIYCGDASQWFPAFALPLTDFGTVIISIGIIFVYLFFNSILKTKKKIPAASRTFLISASINVFAILLYIAGFRSLTTIINMIVSLSVFVVAVILCFHLRREKIIRLIFIGFVIGFMVLIFWILMLQNLFPYSRLVNNLFTVQYMWWMIIFSLALELNINNYIKEKYQAQKESLKNLRERDKLILQQNEMLEQKVEERTRELKETQSQLVQREKMASLGELTAGIAHEIQNPLNFINNFSDINSELIDEMKNELIADNSQEAISIANDIKVNEQKINHHGKRADAILKGMLYHSRDSTEQKELADINALADEYLRLSYHGLRAKDITFNATMHTDFDHNIEKINIVPQDIGRVLLNLFNNAFYAVNEKKKKLQLLKGSEDPPAEHPEYHPLVSVSTKKTGDAVEIKVKDNGDGIPQKVLDKIFQPFFTTKPTGQGTGLGLSLSYDIIKAHGGEIKVGTDDGEGAEFIIQLPIV